MFTRLEKISLILVYLGLCATVGYSQQYFTEHTIDASYTAASAIDLKDLNNDGKLDIIAGSHGTQTAPSSGVKCWINGGPSPVSYTGQIVDASYAAITCYAEDLNGDGFIDIIAGSWMSDDIVYWLNSGGNPIVWTRYTLTTGFRDAHGVYAADIDNDGDNDVLGAASGTNEIAVWYNNGGSPIAWTKQTVSNSFGQAKYAYAGDLDEDGDLDIIGTALSNNEIAWWLNDGGNPIIWTKYTIDNAFGGAHGLFLYDIDQDSHLDILSTAYYDGDIAWYRNNGGSPLNWTKQTIEADFTGVFYAISADFDNDGDNDIFGTSQPGNMQSYWLNGGGSPFTWTRHDLTSNNNKPWPAVPFDVDNDGYIDIISGGDLRVAWWENISNVPSAPDNFTAYSDYTTPTSILLKWHDPATYNNGTSLSDFQLHIYRGETFIAVVDSGLEEYIDAGLTEHQQYSYSIRTAIVSDSSPPVSVVAYAGGCPYSLPPTLFSVRDSGAGIFLQWKNPTKHTDGSPLNDLASILIYRNNLLSDSLEQTHLDTGQIRTYLDMVEGYHEYYIRVRDNDSPPHFSTTTVSLFGYGGEPFVEYLENFEYGKGLVYSTGDWDTTGIISFSGDHSFTDSPEGDYPRYANTFFLLPPAVVGEDYALRFHDIAIVSLYHYAYIEISTDARKTFSLITKYNSTAYAPWNDGHADPGDWRKEIIDLSPYTGDTVTIRFRLQTSSGIIMDGWYIDSITIGQPDTVTPIITRTVSLNEGWNLISLPIDCEDKSTTSLFPAFASSAFTFLNGYVPSDSFTICHGYWLKYDSIDEITITGNLIDTDTIDIKSGWNMIGSLSDGIDTSDIISIPADIIQSDYFGYDTSYRPVSRLESGRGYWVRTSADGILKMEPQMHASRSVPARDHRFDALNILKVRDDRGNVRNLYFGKGITDANRGDLPPLPPEDAFDVRFSSNRYIESFSSDKAKIKLKTQGVYYPLTIEWNVKEHDAAQWTLLSDGIKIIIEGFNRVIINNPVELVLAIDEDRAAPSGYMLYQNYPNPFNPNTVIAYDLPAASKVILRVFDILGQVVGTLVEEIQEAGRWEIEWQAGNTASGIYYIHLEANDVSNPSGGYTMMNKMMLLR